MEVFDKAERMGFEEIIFCHDRETGLKAIIGIHDTALGPALGGARMYPYPDEEEALEDLLKLAEAMTLKNAVAGLDLGGGKAVILGDPAREKNEFLLRAFGRFIERQKGRYITSIDMGIGPQDIDVIRRETAYARGGSASGGRGGDPSPATARGVVESMKVCMEEVYGSPVLQKKVVAVQGLGSVGYHLCRLLAEEGAELVVADIDENKVNTVVSEFEARVSEPELIYDEECDLFAPCAKGGVINDETIPRLRCSIIAGAANNMLEREELGETLYNRGILYAPDYVVNSGGVTYVAYENSIYTREEIFQLIAGIGKRLKMVLELAKKEKINPLEASWRLADRRLEQARKLLALKKF